MTLYSLVRIIQNIAKKQPNVNGAYEGSIYQINADPSVKYSNVIITQREHQEMDNTFTYNLIIFFCDRLVDDLEANRLQVESNGIKVLSNILKTLEQEYDVEIEQKRYTTYSERFKDLCAGAYVNVLITAYDNEECAEIFE